jgi:hypothetical protein
LHSANISRISIKTINPADSPVINNKNITSHRMNFTVFTSDLGVKLVTAVVAGVISFAAAWILRGIDRNRAFKDKKIEHAEATITHFSHYIESWRRLINIAQLQSRRTLSEAEKERMERYVLERDESKHSLVSQISTLPLFFDTTVIKECELFKKWDSEQSTKRLNELPNIEEWERWQQKLSKVLQKHIQ